MIEKVKGKGKTLDCNEFLIFWKKEFQKRNMETEPFFTTIMDYLEKIPE